MSLHGGRVAAVDAADASDGPESRSSTMALARLFCYILAEVSRVARRLSCPTPDGVDKNRQAKAGDARPI